MVINCTVDMGKSIGKNTERETANLFQREILYLDLFFQRERHHGRRWDGTLQAAAFQLRHPVERIFVLVPEERHPFPVGTVPLALTALHI